MNTIDQNISPVSQDIIWVAEYMDGSYYTEFDFETKKENSFYEIDKEEIVRFGLLGYGKRMNFEVNSGVFKIAGQMIEIIYKTEQKEYYLTGQQSKYNDIITYKDAESTIDLAGGRVRGTSNSSITQFNVGYKKHINVDDVNFNFKAICKVPMDHPVYMNIWLVSDKDLNGVIQIKKNGKIVEEIYAPLKSNVGGEINWIIQ